MEQNIQSPPKDVYTRVTERIIDLLEHGTIPWRKPWQLGGIPRNLISNRPYTGINAMLLNSLDYTNNYFLTWNQIQSLGGKVKQGEKGEMVVYQNMVEKIVVVNGESSLEKRPILRYYYVFNIEQCTSLPAKCLIGIRDPVEIDKVPYQKIIKSMPLPPSIRFRGNEAYYSVLHDYINMPKVEYFSSAIDLYAVLMHELVHSTGAYHRLARTGVCDTPDFDEEKYSFEELIAEIGSCYLTSFSGIGIANLKNSAAYIQGWLRVLKNDTRFIIKAASKAQQAVDYILNSKQEKEE